MLYASLISSALIEQVQTIAILFYPCNLDCEAVLIRRAEAMRDLVQCWGLMNLHFRTGLVAVESEKVIAECRW